jgi:hypothetical protein
MISPSASLQVSSVSVCASQSMRAARQTEWGLGPGDGTEKAQCRGSATGDRGTALTPMVKP